MIRNQVKRSLGVARLNYVLLTHRFFFLFVIYQTRATMFYRDIQASFLQNNSVAQIRSKITPSQHVIAEHYPETLTCIHL